DFHLLERDRLVARCVRFRLRLLRHCGNRHAHHRQRNRRCNGCLAKVHLLSPQTWPWASGRLRHGISNVQRLGATSQTYPLDESSKPLCVPIYYQHKPVVYCFLAISRPGQNPMCEGKTRKRENCKTVAAPGTGRRQDRASLLVAYWY